MKHETKTRKFEVKVAGYSIGVTKWFKDAELWFKKTNQNLRATIHYLI